MHLQHQPYNWSSSSSAPFFTPWFMAHGPLHGVTSDFRCFMLASQYHQNEYSCCMQTSSLLVQDSQQFGDEEVQFRSQASAQGSAQQPRVHISSCPSPSTSSRSSHARTKNDLEMMVRCKYWLFFTTVTPLFFSTHLACTLHTHQSPSKTACVFSRQVTCL
jgi:hypothetical protein